MVGMVADEAGELVIAQLADGRVEEERIHLQHLVVGQVASPPPVGGGEGIHERGVPVLHGFGREHRRPVRLTRGRGSVRVGVEARRHRCYLLFGWTEDDPRHENDCAAWPRRQG